MSQLGLALEAEISTRHLDFSRPAGLNQAARWSGNLENLRIAAGRSTARYRGPVFMDSDVYKRLEAAAWEMGRAPSEWLRSTTEATIDLVAAAQGADGYINSYYSTARRSRG
jgi:uncharacterized protein